MKLTTNRARLLAAPVLVTLALTGAAQATDSASRSSRIAAAADAAVAAGVPGLVVYARNANQTTLLARGFDKLDAKRPMTTDDRFRIACDDPKKRQRRSGGAPTDLLILWRRGTRHERSPVMEVDKPLRIGQRVVGPWG